MHARRMAEVFRRRLIGSSLFVMLFLTLMQSVSALVYRGQLYTGYSFFGVGFDDLTFFYLQYAGWFDFFILLILFVSIVKFAIGDKFKGNAAKGLALSLGVVLSLSAVLAAQNANPPFSILQSLGPLTFVLALLLVSSMVFLLCKNRLGAPNWLSIMLALITAGALWYGVAGFTGLGSGRLFLPILDNVRDLGFIALIAFFILALLYFLGRGGVHAGRGIRDRWRDWRSGGGPGHAPPGHRRGIRDRLPRWLGGRRTDPGPQAIPPDEGILPDPQASPSEPPPVPPGSYRILVEGGVIPSMAPGQSFTLNVFIDPTPPEPLNLLVRSNISYTGPQGEVRIPLSDATIPYVGGEPRPFRFTIPPDIDIPPDAHDARYNFSILVPTDEQGFVPYHGSVAIIRDGAADAPHAEFFSPDQQTEFVVNEKLIVGWRFRGIPRDYPLKVAAGFTFTEPVDGRVANDGQLAYFNHQGNMEGTRTFTLPDIQENERPFWIILLFPMDDPDGNPTQIYVHPHGPFILRKNAGAGPTPDQQGPDQPEPDTGQTTPVTIRLINPANEGDSLPVGRAYTFEWEILGLNEDETVELYWGFSYDGRDETYRPMNRRPLPSPSRFGFELPDAFFPQDVPNGQTVFFKAGFVNPRTQQMEQISFGPYHLTNPPQGEAPRGITARGSDTDQETSSVFEFTAPPFNQHYPIGEPIQAVAWRILNPPEDFDLQARYTELNYVIIPVGQTPPRNLEGNLYPVQNPAQDYFERSNNILESFVLNFAPQIPANYPNDVEEFALWFVLRDPRINGNQYFIAPDPIIVHKGPKRITAVEKTPEDGLGELPFLITLVNPVKIGDTVPLGGAFDLAWQITLQDQNIHPNFSLQWAYSVNGEKGRYTRLTETFASGLQGKKSITLPLDGSVKHTDQIYFKAAIVRESGFILSNALGPYNVQAAIGQNKSSLPPYKKEYGDTGSVPAGGNPKDDLGSSSTGNAIRHQFDINPRQEVYLSGNQVTQASAETVEYNWVLINLPKGVEIGGADFYYCYSEKTPDGTSTWKKMNVSAGSLNIQDIVGSERSLVSCRHPIPPLQDGINEAKVWFGLDVKANRALPQFMSLAPYIIRRTPSGTNERRNPEVQGAAFFVTPKRDLYEQRKSFVKVGWALRGYARDFTPANPQIDYCFSQGKPDVNRDMIWTPSGLRVETKPFGAENEFDSNWDVFVENFTIPSLPGEANMNLWFRLKADNFAGQILLSDFSLQVTSLENAREQTTETTRFVIDPEKDFYETDTSAKIGWRLIGLRTTPQGPKISYLYSDEEPDVRDPNWTRFQKNPNIVPLGALPGTNVHFYVETNIPPLPEGVTHAKLWFKFEAREYGQVLRSNPIIVKAPGAEDPQRLLEETQEESSGSPRVSFTYELSQGEQALSNGQVITLHKHPVDSRSNTHPQNEFPFILNITNNGDASANWSLSYSSTDDVIRMDPRNQSGKLGPSRRSSVVLNIDLNKFNKRRRKYDVILYYPNEQKETESFKFTLFMRS